MWTEIRIISRESLLSALQRCEKSLHMEIVEVYRLMTYMTPIKQCESVDAFRDQLLVIIADLVKNIV